MPIADSLDTMPFLLDPLVEYTMLTGVCTLRYRFGRDPAWEPGQYGHIFAQYEHACWSSWPLYSTVGYIIVGASFHIGLILLPKPSI